MSTVFWWKLNDFSGKNRQLFYFLINIQKDLEDHILGLELILQ